jgi:hypothetical protein
LLASFMCASQIIIIIIFHHEFRPGWPVSVSAVISSSSLLSGFPSCHLPFGWQFRICFGSLLFYEHVATTCVYMYIICLLRMWHGAIPKFLRFFCGQEECTLLFAVNISFLWSEAYFCHTV